MARFLAALSLALFAALPVQAQVIFSDNFDRPDNVNLGPNYQVIGTASATRVIGNQAGNVTTANNLSLVTPANFSAAYTTTRMSADIFRTAPGTFGFATLAFGHNGVAAAGNGLYIKVQSNTAAGVNFDSIGFYTGVGGSTTSFWTDPPIFFLITATAFPSARMTVYASDATTINLELDTDFNGTPDQTFTRHLNLATMTFGTQAGVAVSGAGVRMDNLTISAVPEPGSLTLLGIGAVLVGRYVRRRIK